LFYKKERNKLPNKKKRYGLSQKKFNFFVFPHHNINKKNVGSIERDVKQDLTRIQGRVIKIEKGGRLKKYHP
jgi:hypothetical protein